MSIKVKLFQPRPIKPGEGDGFWVNNDTTDRILAQCKRGTKLLVLFYILNAIMSEAKCRRFETSIQQLAKRSGLKPGAIERHLCGLQYCGVILFKPGKSKEPGALTVTILGEVRL